ncbi:DHA2 family efflux MFS transporter permease subunit [Acidocella sp.]|uniref:DHA2 family efflux MFS transporter permease subunit n=1 Tax=Acidocella sp. TaxID=50710 RepID=UPI0026317215|nr:DHA2 family efflux MFS transporter permease subunit [Acidocella sp.]MDD2795072.1 DHA2 family efflux MFS transporter permease subunit [Acidocella sp.]
MTKAAPPPLSLRTKIAVGGAMLGAFMAVLNIQIINTSLPEIQGGIGTGLEDGGWISTSYLIGEIIVIPLSGWLVEVFSMRRYFIGSTVLFLFFSAACGLAGNFPELVGLRLLQGFTGGALIPLAFTCLITMLPERVRPTGFAAYALTVTFAPAIGPTIGGTITDLYGWRAIFFLNLVPGAVMLLALLWGLNPAPMQLEKFRRGDWLGIATIAIGLGSLQIVLEEGNNDDWFNSPLIFRLSVVAAIALSAFLLQELRPGNRAPLVNLRLFTRWNFALGCFTALILGFVLYAAVYLIPIYLAEAHGYSARQAGNVMAWIGLPQLIIIPFTPYLMRRVDPRYLLMSGFLLFSISCFWSINLGPQDSGPQLLIPNLIRALGQAMIFPPITLIVTSGIPFADSSSASSLFNMMRNLGGAIGIAMVQTFITNREKFHSAIMMPHISLLNPATRQRLALLQHYFATHSISGPQDARHAAIIAIGRTVQAQAFYLAYGDAFALLGAFMLIGVLVIAFLQKPAGRAVPGGH